MELSLQHPGDHLFIRAVSNRGIQIGEQWYASSLIISPEELLSDWRARSMEDLTELLLEPVFAFKPDVVILGTGASQHFLPPELMIRFYQRGAGVESMTTGAACRTFNVLVSEGRKVVAALMQQGPAQC